ncbi:unnamed protein product [Sphenostylis stenocarpa]|uniref:Uncharacterized protein n=1 Tax=Sphenostylis stenocarpa TaxID=92480 RepID=A0AA87B8S5_9FABA|nr:unnamed protein product [Sphenostylis stenocarpa]
MNGFGDPLQLQTQEKTVFLDCKGSMPRLGLWSKIIKLKMWSIVDLITPPLCRRKMFSLGEKGWKFQQVHWEAKSEISPLTADSGPAQVTQQKLFCCGYWSDHLPQYVALDKCKKKLDPLEGKRKFLAGGYLDDISFDEMVPSYLKLNHIA